MIPKEILQNVKKIEISTRGLVNEIFSGEYHSAFKGLGMEFAEVREYQPGDDIRKIDWNVTARAGKAYIKSFDEERDLTVMLMVDISQSSQFGTAGRMKGEIAVELAAILAFSAIRNNDKVGLILFTDQVELYIPPRKGRTHVLRVIRELLYFKPQHSGTDIAGALEYLNRVTRRKVTCFIFSDFISDSFRKPLQIANKRHDMIALKITDPREHALPGIGLIEFEDAETGEMVMIDTSDAAFRRTFAGGTEQTDAEREQLFRQIGVDLISIDTDKSYVEPIVRFFRSRDQRGR